MRFGLIRSQRQAGPWAPTLASQQHIALLVSRAALLSPRLLNRMPIQTVQASTGGTGRYLHRHEEAAAPRRPQQQAVHPLHRSVVCIGPSRM